MIENNLNQKINNIISLLKAFHIAISSFLFYIIWLVFRYGTFQVIGSRGFRYNYLILAGYIILLLFFNRTYNAFLLGYNRIRTLAFSQFLAQLFSVILVYFAVSIAWNHFDSPFPFLVLLVIQLFFDAVWSYYANSYYLNNTPTKKTILLYRNKLDRKRFGVIKGKPSERLFDIVEEYQYQGDSFDEIKEKVQGYDAVFVAGVRSRCRNSILKYCKETNTPGFFLPHIGDMLMRETIHIQSFDSPVFFISRKVLPPEYAFIKRVFDILASLLGIIILSPLMIITAFAIKLYDGGPVLYKQVRLTKDSREFNIYKFRSMITDAESDGVARLSTGNTDSRITPIGRIIRAIRFDEFPQLLNILKGDMSIVGPRPERPEIAERYYKTMPEFKLRLQVQAGLTGYAQVYGKYNTDPYEKLEFDLLYIQNMSVLTDLQLIFATFEILFSKESTEGVSEDAITAMKDEENND